MTRAGWIFAGLLGAALAVVLISDACGPDPWRDAAEAAEAEADRARETAVAASERARAAEARAREDSARLAAVEAREAAQRRRAEAAERRAAAAERAARLDAERAGDDLATTLEAVPGPLGDTARAQLGRLQDAHDSERSAWRRQMEARAELLAGRDTLIAGLRDRVGGLLEERDALRRSEDAMRARALAAEEAMAKWKRAASPDLWTRARREATRAAVWTGVGYLLGS